MIFSYAPSLPRRSFAMLRMTTGGARIRQGLGMTTGRSGMTSTLPSRGRIAPFVIPRERMRREGFFSYRPGLLRRSFAMLRYNGRGVGMK
jgi:hypothetical protein